MQISVIHCIIASFFESFLDLTMYVNKNNNNNNNYVLTSFNAHFIILIIIFGGPVLLSTCGSSAPVIFLDISFAPQTSVFEYF